MQAASFRLALLFFFAVLLAACGQLPERPSGPGPADPDIARAQQLEASGDHLAAAELYRALASRTPALEQRSIYLLNAAEASKNGGDWDGTRAALAQLAALPLPPTPALQRTLLQAEVLLQENRATEALSVLGDMPDAAQPRELRIRHQSDVAAAYRQLGNLLETANTLQNVDALQTDVDARLQTQTEILRNEQVLIQLQPSPPGVAGG